MKQTWICVECGSLVYDLSCKIECMDCPTRCPHTIKDERGRQKVPDFQLVEEQPVEYYED